MARNTHTSEGPIRFSGQCEDCDRTVARHFPPTSHFLQTWEAWIRCRECQSPILATKDHAAQR